MNMVMAFQAANLALSFLLELCTLAALGYWGFHTGRNMPMAVVLGVGAPLLAALVWGTFVAPKATIPVSAPLHIALQIVIFGLAAAGLAAAGRSPLAWILGAAVVINGALAYAWGQ